MGDAGRLYVSPDVVPVYQGMLSLASVITPNWFEVEYVHSIRTGRIILFTVNYRTLTNTVLSDLPSLQRALNILHNELKVPNIVISSIPLKPWLLDALPANIRPSTSNATEISDYLLCISSSSDPSKNTSSVHAQCVPLIPGYFSGVGDLFSALLLGHFDPTSTSLTPPHTPLSYAASQALTKTHAVLTLTYEYASKLPEEDRLVTDDEKDTDEPLRRTRRMKGRELRLVQGQDIFRRQTNGDIRQMEAWTGFWGS